MRCLPVNIYKHQNSDCSNGGISSRYDEILLICDDGFIEVDENNPPENLCKVVKRHLFWRDYYHVEPVAKAEGAGWMYGGCIVCTSDSRFRFDYPLKLHDRTETWEQYNENW